MVCVINCRRNASVQPVVCECVCVEGAEMVWGGGSGRRGWGGSSSVTGICSVVRAPYLSASLNQFHAEVS